MTFDEYQKQTLATAKDKGFELTHRTFGLASEAGEVAGKLAKWQRDSGGDIAKLNKEELAKELGDVMWFVATLGDYIGYRLEDIAKINIEKLADRQKRNVISGSGDNR